MIKQKYAFFDKTLLFTLFFCGCGSNRKKRNPQNDEQKTENYEAKNENKPIRFCLFCGAKLDDLTPESIICPNCGSEL